MEINLVMNELKVIEWAEMTLSFNTNKISLDQNKKEKKRK